MASDMQDAVPGDFFSRLSLHQLRAMSPRQLEHSGRLVAPVILEAGSSHYRPIGWNDAFQLIAGELRAAGPARSFFYASGRSSNEAGFLLQMLARQFGTNYVNNCSYYCHQASGVGLASSIGTGAGTIQLEDLDHVDLYILVGANPASNHPRLMRSLVHIRRCGGKIVVINPLRELGLVNFRVPSDVRSLLFGSQIASDYIQPHIGGDLALFTGIAAKNVVIAWAMGITHHAHGTNTVQAIANLALLRGMVGRRHAGLMPIRGHSNVQGMGSVGVTPTLKKAMLERLEQRLGIRVPQSPGYDTMACMQASTRAMPGGRGAGRSFCLCCRATKSRSRRRKSRCSAMSA
jgi:anaerobic selenocysteine-containing dehydrogenase